MPTSPAQVLSVTDLTRRVKDLLEEKFPAVWVEGEISNLRSPTSGHVYFTLKDPNAQLAVVVFRGIAAKVGFAIKDGLQVIAFGDVSVYERSGQYQLVARQLLPKGLGALQLAFEELKQRLAKEGLFDAARKKPVPALPQHIALVTSPTGAAIRDFLNIISRRFPNVRIIISPVRVQGDGAGKEIAEAIDELNILHASRALTLDVIVVTRGGGSLEDLWAFNEEVVARALARSAIPTISAVGHEIDFTISDFVADLRAPTPSAAAELVVKAKDEFVRQLAQYQTRLQKDLRLQLAEARQRFSALASSYVFRRPTETIRRYQQQLDDYAHRLRRAPGATVAAHRARWETASQKFRVLGPQAMLANWRQRLAADDRQLRSAWAQRLQTVRHRLSQAGTRLELLSPNSTLQRGYSITVVPATGGVVRSVTAVQPGTTISTKVLDGTFDSVVSSQLDA
ncbi:MAG TPA: exodeoxyribonuclease VII large subunit [Verrucomicrobiae bacterium]|nr:exodeoxyribonuclease VII large subunit [Verrucomicrobiae bacterium]